MRRRNRNLIIWSLIVTGQRQLPWQVFQFASSLLPYLDSIFEESNISPTDLFILSHLKHFGIEDSETGRKVMLKNELRNILIRVYGYSPARTTTILKNLHNKRLIGLDDLTEGEKEKLFNTRRGYKPAVILLGEGINKLNEFNTKIDNLFSTLTADMSATKYKGLSIALNFFAKHATARLAK